MRTITHIIIHCSATREGQTVTLKTIDNWHRQQGYAISGVTLSGAKVLTVNYYGQYDFMDKNDVSASTDNGFMYETVICLR